MTEHMAINNLNGETSHDRSYNNLALGLITKIGLLELPTRLSITRLTKKRKS